ncbi:MAG: DNA polymerase III subunit alpha [Mariprofundaceae bacterium]
MRFSPFAHLHVHSDYSLLAGAMSVKNLLNRVHELRQPAVALTDHGNLFGAVDFYTEAMKRGIKPILGCEVYVCPDHQEKRNTGPRQPVYDQLLLLARSNRGWQNLMRLVSISYLEGFYYKPRVDKKLLAQFGEGLIALSSGWHGEISRHLRAGQTEAARQAAQEYAGLFSSDCFFIELQRHGAAGQEALNRQLIELAHDTGLSLVASNNVHFLGRDDFHAFEAMLCLQNNRNMHDDVAGHYTPECYLKSHEDMEALFADVPEALENSLHIAQRCNVDLQLGQYQLPDFAVPDGMSLSDYMRDEAEKGLNARWAKAPGEAHEAYDARLVEELGIIEKMGFCGYFLIVADFVRWAKDHDIPVGPGRGSGAGSLVAYSLGITDLDPIRYGLLFERFLNPERVSMPDFDIDFCMSRRDEVIDYVTERYGADRVAQIITYGSMKAKAVVRDVGRVLGLPYSRVDQLAKLVPTSLDITLDKAFAQEPALQKEVDNDPEVARLFDIARRLEGLHRHAGKHAAGVVIGRKPLVETAPLYKDSRDSRDDGGMVVQWDMKCAEKVGLIKFDFLGLKTLTVLHLASQLVRRHGKDEVEKGFNVESIPLDDAKTFQLLQKGATGAVFQLESSGMRDLLTRIKPDCFEDIIALVALYRPGPLQSGMVDDFIERKSGRTDVVYALPQLEPILSETYGVILYQEQVMKIAQVLASYSLGQADLLRRAMGKKKPEEMAKQRKVFLDGAAADGIVASKAEYIFDLMEKFAGYGFNKSHSAAYALIAYQTAYLKAHYPQAFMAATLSCDMGNSDKVTMLVRDCQSMDLRMLPPDINASDWEFIPEGEVIRFGLGAIKGVGEAAIREVVVARADGGHFDNMDGFLLRVSAKSLNKRMLEALIKAGALDGLIPHRHAGLVCLGATLERASRKRKEKEAGQSALFGANEIEVDQSAMADIEVWGLGDMLKHEREVLGFYLTGHPLEEYLGKVSGLTDGHLGQLPEWREGMQVILAVSAGQIRIHHGGRGTMAFVRIEDLHGGAELVFFSRLYERVAAYLQADEALLVAATVDRSRDEPTLRAEDVMLLDEALEQLVEKIEIRASATACDANTIHQIKALAEEFPGPATLRFMMRLGDGNTAELQSPLGLCWHAQVKQRLEAWFDADAIHLRCKRWQPRSANKHRGKTRENMKHAA